MFIRIDVEEAERFIRQYGSETGQTPAQTEERIREVRRDIARNGHYAHTEDELSYGAKLAWRNSNRCVGRLFWETLHVFDARGAQTEEEIAGALIRHIDYATNGGRICPAITIFRPAVEPSRDVRILNYQLIRYAGHEDGQAIVGDPDSAAFTRLCKKYGWSGTGGPHDVLPLAVQIGEQPPKLFDIPPESVLEVPITHPDIEAIGRLELRWYAVPIVSNMRLEIGGISYTAAPFNGWYMGTEIGARNLADVHRYNLLPRVAALMGLDTSKESTLWKDRALVELNAAVLHSYKAHGVTIVDHHTAAQQFMTFETKEARQGRRVTGDWTWLIPPLSPAATPIFHRSYEDRTQTPNFFYRDNPIG